MNGNLKMATNYTNRFGHKIQVDSTVGDYYFNKDNNLSLYYKKDFDYTNLIEEDYDIKYESQFAIESFLDFKSGKQGRGKKLKYNFFENSHISFLYAKSMCQNILEFGVHHPLGIILFKPSMVGLSVEKLQNKGFEILSNDLVAYMYSGTARLRYFYLIGMKTAPAFLQSSGNHNINWGGLHIKNFNQFKEVYLDSVKYNTQLYQEDRFFNRPKHELPDNYKTFYQQTDKFFGMDGDIGGMSYLVCCDMNNEHKVEGWNDEDPIIYKRILKNSFPLKVYIGKCESDKSMGFIDCKKRILNFLYSGNRKINIEFRYINKISDIPKHNDYKGFAFYTDCNVEWDSNILELFYFTHSQKNMIKYNNNVQVINCEFEKL